MDERVDGRDEEGEAGVHNPAGTPTGMASHGVLC